MAHHCPDCGFVNVAGARYCTKCGALLVAEPAAGTSTVSFEIDAYADVAVNDEPGAAGSRAQLVIRMGGKSGDSFDLVGDRISVGRSPDADIFLDDVTVSRSHAVIVRRDDGLHIDDLGSLNGTYVNRRRIETHRLVDGDDLQIGKFKLSFLGR